MYKKLIISCMVSVLLVLIVLIVIAESFAPRIYPIIPYIVSMVFGLSIIFWFVCGNLYNKGLDKIDILFLMDMVLLALIMYTLYF